MQTILTPEQELALQEYTNVYPLRRSKVDQARELVNEILAKRDELARVLGLERINISIDIFDESNPDSDMDAVSYTLAQATELKHNDILHCKACSIQEPHYRNVTYISDYDRRLEMCIRHKK